MKTPRSLAASSALAALLLVAPARAQVPSDKLAQASNFFDAGAQAYKAGQYLVAAEAFLKANEIAPSPSLLFSAAQAFRRQYLRQPAAPALRRAIELYRDYLRIDTNGKRREDAMQALSTLVAIEGHVEPGAGGEPAKEPAKEPATTRLLITSPAEGAEVSIDGGPFALAPHVFTVHAGPRHVRVRAPGYLDEQVMTDAVEHELVPRHVVLRPKPARLTVTGPAGGRVAVDGQLRATLPLAQPILVEPGAHFVAVTLAGHVPFGQVIEAARDTAPEVAASLPLTRQRVVAWSTIGVGLGGVVGTGVLTGLAIVNRNTAATLHNQRILHPPLTTGDRDRYNAALRARDDFTQAAGITGGVSVAVIAAGLGLYAFDRSEVLPPSDERLKSGPRPGPQIELDIGALSIGVHGSF